MRWIFVTRSDRGKGEREGRNMRMDILFLHGYFFFIPVTDLLKIHSSELAHLIFYVRICLVLHKYFNCLTESFPCCFVKRSISLLQYGKRGENEFLCVRIRNKEEFEARTNLKNGNNEES